MPSSMTARRLPDEKSIEFIWIFKRLTVVTTPRRRAFQPSSPNIPSSTHWRAVNARKTKHRAGVYEFLYAMAGLSPNTPIYGRIQPEGLPGPDLLSDYRFFGIANYVSDMGGRDFARSD